MSTRISLMLPGAVALGAYEGGAVAAILTAVQAAKGDLVVDSIASASAGSITALAASRALLCGHDPLDLMTRTWVELPALERLENRKPDAPLSMAALREAAKAIVGPPAAGTPAPAGHRQTVPVRLSIALTALGGLTYELPALRGDGDERTVSTISATTHRDFVNASLAPTPSGEPDFSALVEYALASGSTPVGFPPLLLDRLHDAAAYRQAGLAHPAPDTERGWSIWYSDGGDLDNEPFGRLLDLIDQVQVEDGPDRDDDRVIVVLDIEPSAPSWKGKWFDPAETPSWNSTLLRVNRIQKSQSYYDDLRRLEKTNTHLEWLADVSAALEEAFADLRATVPASSVADVDRALQSVLEVGRRIDADQDAIRRAAKRGATGSVPGATGPVPATSISELLATATGLAGKRAVKVEIISPDLGGGGLSAEQQLAGEFLFHFGGFLDVAFRRNDFAIGYRDAASWLDGWLGHQVHDRDAVMARVRAVEGEMDGWARRRDGGASVASLGWREKCQVLRLALHVLRVVAHGFRTDRRPG